ncbi:OmpP1/FadL family transporter [Chitinimonas prasina]|nr:OmpP1/FadL family transporter [Chitinimonas prasina]
MTMHALRVTALLVGAAFAHQAYASGYHFGTQSVSAQGTANASGAAAEDASTLFYNPAGLSNLKGTTMTGVLNVVVPNGKFTDEGSHTNPIPGVVQGGRSTANGQKNNNGGDFVEPTGVPHAYMSHQISDRATLGFGLFVPFGSKTQYDDNWVGRYNIIKTELKTIALNPSFSLKVNEKVSFGAGITAQHIEGKLIKAADFGTGAIAALLPAVQAGQVPASMLQLLGNVGVGKGPLPGNPEYDGRVKIKGDDWGFGWNMGVMFNIDEDTRIGMAYRSKISHKLTGTAEWTLPEANLKALPAVGSTVYNGLIARGYVNGAANLAVDTPESISISGYTKISDRLALMGDITRTRHSRFQDLTVNFTTGLAPSNTPEDWKDTTKVSFGGSYKLNDSWLLRAGLAYDESPVNDNNRTPSIPDMDRKWFSVGANWAVSKHSSFDLAYSYVHVGEPTINNYDNGGLAPGVCDSTKNTSSCATVKGRYDVYSHILGIQYNLAF